MGMEPERPGQIAPPKAALQRRAKVESFLAAQGILNLPIFKSRTKDSSKIEAWALRAVQLKYPDVTREEMNKIFDSDVDADF
jgi:hypothetical protein